jgi:hypothetical protein
VDVPLELYRPLLSYDEVGGVLEGTPSGLFDKLHSLLGLQPINDGQARLALLLKRLQIPAATAKAALTELKALLVNSTGGTGVGLGREARAGPGGGRATGHR